MFSRVLVNRMIKKGQKAWRIFHVCPFCDKEIIERDIVFEVRDIYTQPIFIHHTRNLSAHVARRHKIKLLKKTDYKDKFNEYDCPICGKSELGYYFALRHYLSHHRKDIYSDLREVSEEELLRREKREEKVRKVCRKELRELLEKEPEALEEVTQVFDRLRSDIVAYCENCTYYAERTHCRGCIFDILLRRIEKIRKGLD